MEGKGFGGLLGEVCESKRLLLFLLYNNLSSERCLCVVKDTEVGGSAELSALVNTHFNYVSLLPFNKTGKF